MSGCVRVGTNAACHERCLPECGVGAPCRIASPKRQAGLLCHVYRWRLGDCTNGGVSAGNDCFVLVGAEGPFEPNDRHPALYLARWYGRTIACPEDLEAAYPLRRNQRDDCSIEHPGCWMFGGNFIYSSDSRFPTKAPIAVYDRREA